jgi:hypothetical protein
MLPNHDDCEPGPFVCCDTLFTAGAKIRDIALDAINNIECYLDDCNAPRIDGIVTIGPASSYPHADLLTVSLRRMRARQTQISQARPTIPSSQLSEWNVEFIESGWITFGEEGELPDPGYLEMLAMHSYSHAEQMYRRLVNAVATGTIAEGCKGGNCAASIGDLEPIDPLGHLVGWKTTAIVPVDLSKVCDGPTPS